MKNRSILIGSAVVLALAVGTAWAWNQAIWPLNQQSEKAVARQVQLFWDLQVKGDKFGAYQYLAEAYRRRVTPEIFAKQGGNIQWTDAKVKSVQMDDAGAQVELDLKYRFQHQKYSFPEAVVPSKERWIFEGGSWHRWPPELGG